MNAAGRPTCTPQSGFLLRLGHCSSLYSRFLNSETYRRSSTHQSPSEAYTDSASREIPSVLWNPNVHYRIHNSPPHVLTLKSTVLSSRLFKIQAPQRVKSVAVSQPLLYYYCSQPVVQRAVLWFASQHKKSSVSSLNAKRSTTKNSQI
jgi:hypothetical protein